MALVEGVKYGLSASDNNNGSCSLTSGKSQSNSGTTKSVIFVKLTDSALKAIEDYLKSQKTGQQQPTTLQFLGNEGRIQIPSSGGSSRFDFSLSSNADIEGPQGSFECIQQCSSSSLKSMGTVPFKMRIHAKDDVYETTRQRMNALEETRKHDCAKEIKPNGADIGRRVKKKFPRSSVVLPPVRDHHHHQPSPNYSSNSNNNNNNNNNQNFRAQINKPINGHNPPSYQANNNSNNHVSGTHLSPNNHLNNNLNRNIASLPNGNSTNKPSSGGGDISRRPLRDRLIHLLGLKPYKKPELMARLQRDGLKPKDKPFVMPLLSQVSVLRNNEYILNRGIWNDIQEDWPFYSDHERQIMKRRKPQNLTPPGSDCSVGSVGSLGSLSPRSSMSNGSGHSPTGSYSNKTTNGQEPYLPGTKRPSPLDFEQDDNSKRTRISHFKRPNSFYSNQNQTNSTGSSNSRDFAYQSPSSIPYRSIPNNAHHQPPNERLSPPAINHPTGPPEMDLSPNSYDYPAYPWNAKQMDQSGYEEGIKLPDSDETDSIDSGNGSSSSSGSGKSDYSNGSLAGNYSGIGKSTPDPIGSPPTNSFHHGSTTASDSMKNEPTEVIDEGRDEYPHPPPPPPPPPATQHVISKESRNSGFKKSERGKERSRGDREARKEGKHEKNRERLTQKKDQPSYLTEFQSIRTREQRNNYKSEFSADYKEYIMLHSVIDKVSKRFAHLEERLRTAEPGSGDYQMVKEQIVQEYNANKSNNDYAESKRKFQYLHGKLSHIKRLVLEYDSSHSNSDYGSQQEDL